MRFRLDCASDDERGVFSSRSRFGSGVSMACGSICPLLLVCGALARIGLAPILLSRGQSFRLRGLSDEQMPARECQDTTLSRLLNLLPLLWRIDM